MFNKTEKTLTLNNGNIKKKSIIQILFVATNLVLFFSWFYLLLLDKNGLQRRVLFANTNDWFMDFYNTIYFSAERKPYLWGNLADKTYLPLAYVLLYPLSLLYDYDIANWGTTYGARYTQLLGVCGGIYLTISFGFLFYTLYKAFTKKESESLKLSILMSLFFSGITLFCYDRANLWTIAIALVFVFFLTYKSESTEYKNIGIFSLAVASVLKIFPAIFGVVLIYEKKWKEAVLAIIEGILLTIVPFFFIEGGFTNNIYLFIAALKAHGKQYANGCIGFNCDVIFNFPHKNWTIIGYVAMVVALFVAKFLSERDKVALLILAMIITSGQQGYYCLLLLFLPIVLFLLDEWRKTDIVYCAVFIALIQPLQYLYVSNLFIINNYSVSNTLLIGLYIILLGKGVLAALNPKV